jgi:MFS family permease
MDSKKLTIILCLVEILGLATFATFPALLPTFLAQWKLSNTEAGWISAVYYAGYMVAVPVLVGLTDRIDARKILLLGGVMGGLSSLGFAIFARGFWTSFWLRFLAGISLAGTYMPGLKVVSDHTEGSLQSRYVSFYTASFSIGASFSYLLAGEIASVIGWRWAFGASALGSLGMLLLVTLFVPSSKVSSIKKSDRPLIDFLPVIKAKETMAYILGYAAHMWELFSMRSWIVVFLDFSQSLQPAGSFRWSATQVAFLINLIGLPASIGGNEVARRLGRLRVLITLMTMSAALSAVIGFLSSLPYIIVVFACILYGVTVTSDSASLTAGAVAAAPAGYRGTTLAVHSTLGFGAAFLGPLVVGFVLDLFRGPTTFAWGMGFLTMGLGCAMGPVFLAVLGHGKKTVIIPLNNTLRS